MFLELSFSNPWVIGIEVNTVLILIAIIAPKKLLTWAGLINAWLLGVIIWGTLGLSGYSVIMFYFLFGSAVTRVGMTEKEAQGIAEKRAGARGPENVWGSALVGTICAITTLMVKPELVPLFTLAYVSSLSTKLSDTTASEIGKAYGKRTFLITTLQPVPKGTEGAISLEGTLAGAIASIAIAVVGALVGLISWLGVVYCAIAAFIATNLESLIGATLQSKYTWLSNELVNVINTLIGAIVAVLLALVFSQI